MVVLGNWHLAFEHLFCHGVLVVGGRGEDLGVLGGDHRVPKIKLLTS